MVSNGDDNDTDMVILPPDVDELTDEEDIDDDHLDQEPPAEIPGTLEIILSSKLCPLIDCLNKKLNQFGVFSPNLAIDECMAPYHGYHTSKICIRDTYLSWNFAEK